MYKKDFEKYLQIWGEDTQIRMCIEEMSELTKELCKYLRKKELSRVDQKILDNIAEETADVLNCTEQMAILFGQEKVDKIRQEKIKRTNKYLETDGTEYENSATKVFDLGDILLRPHKFSDAQDMYNNYCSDDEVTKYLPWPTHKSVEDTQEYLKTLLYKYALSNFFEWAIVDKTTNQVVGAVNFRPRENKSGELGYVLSKSKWGQGIMPKCAETVVDYVLGLGYVRVFAKFQIPNKKSGRVMQKIGMEFEGIQKNADTDRDGNYVDFNVYSIVRKKGE